MSSRSRTIDSPSVLEDVEFSSTPFPYFISRQALDPTMADAVHAWLRESAAWRLHQGEFFEQYECELDSAEFPDIGQGITVASLTGRIRERLEPLFGVSLEDRVTINAHKLDIGQGIGLHNDDPEPGYETHRVIVYLGGEFRDTDGGHLVLFNSPDEGDIHRVLRPIHNTAVAMELSNDSYHAVSDVVAGPRYCVIYSFWSADSTREASRVRREGGSSFANSLEGWTKFLITSGAREISHSGSTLLDHLTNTYRILVRWGCRPAVCKAGLFHSIYGTEAFTRAPMTTKDRHRIRELIGQHAERLVNLYSTASRSSLYRNVGRRGPYAIEIQEASRRKVISRATLADLLVLDMANSVEQLPRVQVDAEQSRSEWDLYESAASLLPPEGLDEARSLFNRALGDDRSSGTG